jgi:hypothetical protein
MTTIRQRLLDAFQNGNPLDMASAAKRLGAGWMQTPLKIVVTGATASASWNLSDLRNGQGGCTITSAKDGTALPSGFAPPPLSGQPRSLRVTGSGTSTAVGDYHVTDSGGTMLDPPLMPNTAVGTARCSDNGNTLTFRVTVTGFTLIYMPGPSIDGNSEYPPSS